MQFITIVTKTQYRLSNLVVILLSLVMKLFIPEGHADLIRNFQIIRVPIGTTLLWNLYRMILHVVE